MNICTQVSFFHSILVRVLFRFFLSSSSYLFAEKFSHTMQRCSDALAHHLCMHRNNSNDSYNEATNERRMSDEETERKNEVFCFDLQPRYIQLIISNIEPISEFGARK